MKNIGGYFKSPDSGSYIYKPPQLAPSVIQNKQFGGLESAFTRLL